MSGLVGKRVRIQGIEGRPELNGQNGIADSYRPETQRCVVTLASGEVVALRAANLVDREGDRVGGRGVGGGGGGGGGGGLFDMAMHAAGRGAHQFQQLTGIMVTPNQMGAAMAAIAGMLVYYFFFQGGSQYSNGYRGGYGGGGYGGGIGGFLSGIPDIWWLISAGFLCSTVYRMGGGGTPQGWSFDQMWHRISNMGIWEGMMFLNLIQRVMGGGGRRRRGFY